MKNLLAACDHLQNLPALIPRFFFRNKLLCSIRDGVISSQIVPQLCRNQKLVTEAAEWQRSENLSETFFKFFTGCFYSCDVVMKRCV